MQQTPYSAAADMNTTNASAVDISMAGVGGNRGTYSFRDSKEVFRGVGLESKMKLFGSLAGGIGSMPSDFEFSGDGVSDYSKKSVIENGSGEGAAEEVARTVMSDLVHSSRYDVIPKISTFQGQPAKILVNILKFHKERNGELKRSGSKVDVGDLWSGILDAAIGAGGGEKALKKFWAPMFVDPMKGWEEGEEEGDGDERRRMIRKVVGVLKLAVEGRKNQKKRAGGGGGGGGGMATPNTSRFSALSNYEEFGDEDGGSSSGLGDSGEGRGGGDGGGGGEDEDEFDF